MATVHSYARRLSPRYSKLQGQLKIPGRIEAPKGVNTKVLLDDDFVWNGEQRSEDLMP